MELIRDKWQFVYYQLIMGDIAQFHSLREGWVWRKSATKPKKKLFNKVLNAYYFVLLGHL